MRSDEENLYEGILRIMLFCNFNDKFGAKKEH